MPYFVYILKSCKDGSYYKGSTENYLRRFEEHNAGFCAYTSIKTLWELMYVEQHPDKKSMLIREKKLKRCKAEYFEWLSKQPTNILLK